MRPLFHRSLLLKLVNISLYVTSGWLRGCGCSNPLKYVNPKIWSSLNVDKLFVHYQVHTAYMELLKNISTEVLA